MNMERLDGWKAIADYVGRSVKTVQRWELESDFPILRVPGKRSVFARRDEIDAWLGSSDGNDLHASNEDEPTEHLKPLLSRLWLQLVRPRKVSPLLAIVLVLVLIATLSSASFQDEKNTGLGYLTPQLEGSSAGSHLLIKNSAQETVLERVWLRDWAKYVDRTPAACFFRVQDLNRDGLEDFIIADPESDNGPQLEIYLQTVAGYLQPFKKLDCNYNLEYEGETYPMGRICFLEVTDLNGDKIPEIAVCLHNNNLFPAVLMLLRLSGERLLVVEHPGWLTSVQQRHVGGQNLLITAGTNNFITKFSEPVVFGIMMDWKQTNVKVSLMAAGRKMTDQVNDDVVVAYARLGDFPNNSDMSPWETATLRSNLSDWGQECITVEVGYLEAKTIMKYDVPGSLVHEVRLFEFRSDLSFIRATYLDDVLDVLGIVPSFPKYRGLLVPSYWDGTKWKQRFCYIGSRVEL